MAWCPQGQPEVGSGLQDGWSSPAWQLDFLPGSVGVPKTQK